MYVYTWKCTCTLNTHLSQSMPSTDFLFSLTLSALLSEDYLFPRTVLLTGHSTQHRTHSSAQPKKKAHSPEVYSLYLYKVKTDYRTQTKVQLTPLSVCIYVHARAYIHSC